MAVITGNSGSMTLPAGITCTVIGFSGELDIDPIAIPPGLGEAWETAQLGAGRCTGSFKAKIDNATAAFVLAGNETSFAGQTSVDGTISLILDASTTPDRTFGGTAIFTQLRLEKDRGGYDILTGNFRNKGAWATA